MTESETSTESAEEDGGHVVSHDVVEDLGRRAVPDFDPELSARARRFHGAFEPIAASVYFAAEVHEEFERLGFGPGVTDDDPKATASVEEILAARLRGQVRNLEQILGDQPALPRATELMRRAADAGVYGGRFLYAGLSSLPEPGTPWGTFWRQVDRVREYRGDCHIAVWCAAGLDPVEAGLLTEIYYQMPTRRYHHGRGWTTGELDAGLERLRTRGIIEGEPVRFTEAGRLVREAIEINTDRQQKPLIDALGDDYEELLSVIEPWAAAIVASPGGYPVDVEQLSAAWGRVYE